MNDKEKRKLAQKLDVRAAEVKRELVDDMREVRELTTENVLGAVGDPGDDSLVRNRADLKQNLARRHASELAHIEGARERMAEGNYGICENCGGEIGFPRLSVQPTAKRCIRCQEQYEKTHVGDGSPSL
ncbi:MAG: TraR/DksA family transcriptional regulator [Burkholderiales bacterium]